MPRSAGHLSVKQIARAFIVSEAGDGAAHHPGKARVAGADVPFETPGAVELAGGSPRWRR